MVTPSGVEPSQSAPELSFLIRGTKTLKVPLSSTNRNGFSAMIGTLSMVVKGLSGHEPPGAPCTPAKTMFHTPPSHSLHVLLRVNHCCCEPGTTFPSTLQSAM